MFWVRLVGCIVLVAGVGAVGVIGFLGMYFGSREDAMKCADLSPDWQRYETCRAMLEQARRLRPGG